MTPEQEMMLKRLMAEQGGAPNPWDAGQGIGEAPLPMTAVNEAPAVGAVPPPAQPGSEAEALVEMLMKRNQILGAPGGVASGTPAPAPTPEPSMLDAMLKRFGIGQ